MTEFLYYPGCSMGGSARGYATSVAAVAEPLGIKLHEIDDWNCCGATEYLSIGPIRAHALIARNLAIAERERNGSSTLVAPCSACYANLVKTDSYVRHDPALAELVNTALDAGGLSYTPGSIQVRHLVEVIVHDIGPEAVRARVTRPLTGLRVAPYLGCLVTRPDPDHRWRSKEQPREFDELLAALGAEVVDYPLRTDCCGGHLSQISPATGLDMIRRLLDAAARLEADVMATVCPMCQMNVDLYQGEVNRRFHTDFKMPILFFTQLMGLAFGFEAHAVGIGSEVVSARHALERIGIAVPVPEGSAEGPAGAAGAAEPARRARSKRGPELPMPRMPGGRERDR